ncbi:hypothetical protein V2G26_006680 [Clonostachys chloroleuca]
MGKLPVLPSDNGALVGLSVRSCRYAHHPPSPESSDGPGVPLAVLVVALQSGLSSSGGTTAKATIGASERRITANFKSGLDAGSRTHPQSLACTSRIYTK